MVLIMAVLSIRLPQLGLPAVENATVVLWDRTNDTKGTIVPSTATYVFTNVAGTATATLVPAELGQVNEVRIVIRGDVVFSATFFMPGADAFLDELPMNVEGDPYAGDDKFVAGLSTMQNDGGGAELFTGVVLSVAHLRTLLAGSGISIATVGDGIIITNTRADGAKGDQGIQGVAGTNGTNGTNGQSAYALAVAGGFVGNEAAWIDSLRGAQGIQGATGNTGAAGQSAYALAVALGFVGNQAQWIASLKGVKGDVGNDGPRGYSAYELAVQNGYAGSEASWIASLKGDAGVNGVNGIDGRSAYEIAVADGFLGSEPEWLATLVGISGVTAWDMTNLTVTCNKPLNMDGATAISNGFTGIPTVSELFTKAAYIVQSGLGAPESYAALSAIKLASPVLTGTRVVEWAITSDALSGGAATTAVKLSIGLVKASALASAVGFIELNYKEDGSVTAVLTTDLGSSSAVTLASAPSHISLAFNAGTIAVRVDNVAQAFSASTYTPTADATLITQFVEPASVTGFAFGKAFSAKQLTAASDFTDTHAAGAADLCGHIIGDAGLPSGPNSVIIVSTAGNYRTQTYTDGDILVVHADGVAVSLIGGLDDIADKTILGNVSGGTAAPVALTVAEGQELLGVNFVTQTRTVSAPNATVPAHRLYASAAETNVDLVLSPKGYGALLAAVPDNTTTGGNKRGQYAVDLQVGRIAATQVASGNYSVVSGQNSTASGGNSFANGTSNLASGDMSVVIGGNATTATAMWSAVLGGQGGDATQTYAAVIAGLNGLASGGKSVVLGGDGTVASGAESVASGYLSTASGPQSVAFGFMANATGSRSAVLCGESGTASGAGSAVVAGVGNTVSGQYSATLGGQGNSVAFAQAVITGGAQSKAPCERSLTYAGGAGVSVARRYISLVGLGCHAVAAGSTSPLVAAYDLGSYTMAAGMVPDFFENDAYAWVRGDAVGVNGADYKSVKIAALVRRVSGTRTVLYQSVTVESETVTLAGNTLAVVATTNGIELQATTPGGGTAAAWMASLNIAFF